ncbi:MAG: aspartate/glutamate racemase family protein [Chitinophagales bacterium]
MQQQLGVLGMGSSTTLFYIEKLNILYHQKFGGDSTCPFKMLNANFNLFNPYLPNQYEKLVPELHRHLIAMNRLGVDKILIPNITLHQTVDHLPEDFLPKHKIIHPYELAIEKLRSENTKEVLVLGSVHTMKSRYVKEKFKQQGIKLLAPTQNEVIQIDKLRNEVYIGESTRESKLAFEQILYKYHRKQRVLIACTELSLALNKKNSNNFIDLATLQLQKALDIFSENR